MNFGMSVAKPQSTLTKIPNIPSAHSDEVFLDEDDVEKEINNINR
jgi:hypothetical protein